MPKREVVSIMSGDDPIHVNPSSMTHSIVILEAEKANLQDGDDQTLVDEIQALVNPTFWPFVAMQCREGNVSSRNYIALVSTSVGPELIEPVVAQMGASDDTSIFLRSQIMSLDGGKTSQTVYALIVFRDDKPRIIISVKEPAIELP